MTIKVTQDLVSPSKYGIKCPNAMDAKYITFHNTANDAPAKNEISYMNGNNNQVSYHFAVDDVEVRQGIPVNRNAWHCGDGSGPNSGNRTSIGVEVCYSKSGGERYKKAEALAIKFIAQLLKEHGWGVDRVKKHEDWSGKHCPHRVLDEGRWGAVKSAIAKELAALNGTKAPAKTGTATKPVKATKPKAPSKKLAVPTGVIRQGARGTAVTQLQNALAAVYFYPDKGAKNNGIDGIYGPKTANAVKRFQSTQAGIANDGIYGSATRAKLVAALKKAGYSV
ncbi:N-acetylmuramoyl-L-alanine amidase [Bacillus pumilus]|uniref:peptidoglycan recognition protein family protein n=1 Tax=Bacillus pumilus TaxID=1408 RepID=UPI00017A5EDB|nr:N-acetylmuramoyl-L-alanine amidase [Bacillus pumilus]EDW22230.1 N-acetylmuramoyl-L-alanine amidase CwlA (Cellwall hydrolase) (Autolysin) [Bacillus pumilus ATCC 7061]MCR4352140.1 N-acetylmuramoyl-L-alanine amidase [Bacillus pumilus]MCY7503951.1 N-acetylmuramoyl-L-alanine amidase [Bacillus pumilus]MDR4269056.1 N-acetylmuramoyl-L-alanine amidase [Bacillus pumilus]MDR4269143.1 N-acetylmuramoyl-L-alanine amidase [Bacillus pumilus]